MVDNYWEQREEQLRTDQEVKKILDYDLVMLCVERYNQILFHKNRLNATAI